MKPFAVLLFVLILASCRKDGETNQDGNPVVKGSINLFITAKHHSWNVPGLDIYLKKDATEFPGTDTSLYPWHTKADASGMVLFKELFIGKYYIYATGYDSAFGAPVTGHMPIELNSFTVTDNEANFDLQVTE
jgi:hypothetical protein